MRGFQFRIHMGLAVRDIEASIRFYETLFGEPPVKVRPGYAKFEPAELALNLALNAVEETPSTSRVSHFGVQVDTPSAVRTDTPCTPHVPTPARTSASGRTPTASSDTPLSCPGSD